MIVLAVIRETVWRRCTSLLFFLLLVAAAFLGLPAVILGESPDAGLGAAALAVLLAAELFGPEASSGSIHLAFARPIRRAHYVLARTAGIVASAWCFLAIVAAVSLATAAVAGTAIDWGSFAEAILGAATDLLFPIALIGLFGTFTTSYANILLFFFYVVAVTTSSDLVAREAPRLQAYVWPELLPDVERGVYTSHLAVISNTLVVLFLACLVMNRRQLPYGSE